MSFHSRKQILLLRYSWSKSNIQISAFNQILQQVSNHHRENLSFSQLKPLEEALKKIKIYPPSVKSRYLPVGKKGTLAVYAIKISSQAFRKESTRQVSKAILFLVSTWF